MPWNETTKDQYARPRERYETDLTDEEWAMVEPLPPPPAKTGRPRKTNLREVCNGLQFMLATGGQWRSIPLCFPPYTTIQYYFCSWRRDLVFVRMMAAFRARVRELYSLMRETSAGHRVPGARARTGGTVRGADRGGDRQPVGENDGERRPFGV